MEKRANAIRKRLIEEDEENEGIPSVGEELSREINLNLLEVCVTK